MFTTAGSLLLLLCWSVAAQPTPTENGQGGVEGFVTVRDGHFELQGKPWFIAGTNIYYLPDKAGMNSSRQAVLDSLQQAAGLGLNVVRTAASSDGPQSYWPSMQPQPGVVDEQVLKDGLDFVVDAACRRGLRLLLMLTNQWAAGGGMQQYVKWAGGGTLTDFYTSPQIKSWYKAYVKAVLTRRNSITGRLYSEDPCILGYDLANEPFNRGDDSGDVLQAWVEEMSGYIKSLDRNHLLTTGQIGYFGKSTPQYWQDNPPIDNAWSNLHQGVALPYNAVCEGTDFVRNHSPPGIDFATLHIWPDAGWACSESCKLEASRSYIRARLDASAATFKKPVVVEEFGKLRPAAVRNAFYAMVYDELKAARDKGQPVGGSLFWMLADSSYADYDGSTVYTTLQAYEQQPSVPYVVEPPTNESAAKDAAFFKFLNYEAFMRCLGRYANGSSSWNSGWEDTLALIKANAQEMAASRSTKGP
ncbi:hypothetical protein N2152v2_005470 [Parachlorella kessleri]